jgi:methylenetetrahydrofolate dehydrogenase (NADP+) / methenyltetrahydrofolate cyclohydrolase
VTARLIDGKAIAATLRSEIATKVAAVGFIPCLAVILVGEDPASQV